MQIIETFITGKENNPFTCEDGIFVSENLVAVVDGVTTNGNCLWNGHRSGYFAKEVLLKSLQEIVDEGQEYLWGSEESAIRILEKLDLSLGRVILARYGKHLSIDEYPRASVILYNNLTKEVISYGDCQCMISDTVYSHVKKIDELNADLRAFYLEYHFMKGMTLQELIENDLGREAILENLRMQSIFENEPGEFGYAVLNGRGIEKKMIKRYKVCPGDEVILASDGYPKLAKTLKESEELLRQVLQEDSMCFRKYRATKGVKPGNVSFDDRAFCRFIV